jgi:hypothetical protein
MADAVTVLSTYVSYDATWDYGQHIGPQLIPGP